MSTGWDGEQWVVGTRCQRHENCEINLKTLGHAEAVVEYEKRVAKSNKRKRPDGQLHFIRKAGA